MRNLVALIHRLPWFANVDENMGELLGGASIALVLKALAAVLGFVFNILLARRIGVEGAGIYYLALTMTMIATVVGRMGLDNALLRFVAANAAEGRWDKVHGVYRKGMLVSAIASTIAMLIIAIGADLAASELFSKPALAEPLRLMAFSILPMSLLTLHAQLLKGLKKISNALFVEGIGVPFFSILLILLLGNKSNINIIAIAYVASTVAVLAFGMRLWRRAVGRRVKRGGDFDLRTLMRVSRPLFLADSMNLIMGWTSIFILGIWASSKSVGIFSIAVRIATLTSFILAAVNSIVAPKFAELYAQSNFVALGKLARTSAKLLSLFAAPLSLLFLLAPKWVLGLFGPDFSAGASVLVILAVGQFINAATGSVGYLLVMTGEEKLFRNAIVVSAMTNIVLNIALVPTIGVVGAALATAISLVLVNVISATLVYSRLSIMTIPIPNILKGALSRGQ